MKVRVYGIAFLFTSFIISSCNKDTSEHSGKEEFKSELKKVENFLFVGVVRETPSLYVYNLDQNKFKQFWYQPREIVIDLSVSPDFMKAYFITALSIEEGGSLPLIRKVKLYLVDLKSMKVSYIKNYGIAGQIITNWEDENNYKIVINIIDKIIATDINQTTQLFNSFGKLLIDESKTFDLLKVGYPKPSQLKRNYESPSRRYYLQAVEDHQFYILNDRTTKQQDTIRSSPLITNQFAWSFDDKFLAANFITKNAVMDSSSIISYSLSNKRIQQKWIGNGIKNFFLLNELLVFDNGLGTESEIILFNLASGKVINNIRTKGGCGLKNIPGVFVYDVVD